ncbi:hypothetical protein RSOL_518430 [Rhizoctonia solani AG-3 Rhs1AP]|uniref:Uncharacterized protein n=1 Tax=Rhizoctonia solani AG-3 Rhs1AP TaxID=1086054 RepID=X8JTI4_9AGAM|nr:hypothetical protein RSOL_518430 [Rhizoctonia solani AG-3 Rhs1AP]
MFVGDGAHPRSRYVFPSPTRSFAYHPGHTFQPCHLVRLPALPFLDARTTFRKGYAPSSRPPDYSHPRHGATRPRSIVLS